MFQPKTTKKPWSSLRIEQHSTARGDTTKCRTQILRNQTICMRSGQLQTEFKVYFDNFIGFAGPDLPCIPMAADEDCETTISQMKFGEMLCLDDLHASVRIPREQTQQSAASFEDC